MKAWAVVPADSVYSDHGNAERGAQLARESGVKHVRVVEIDASAFFHLPERECLGHPTVCDDVGRMVYCDGPCTRP
jgi:hypothetical protein